MRFTLLLLCLVLISSNAVAQSREAASHCPVIGIIHLKQYLLRREISCFRNRDSAEVNGFHGFDLPKQKVPKRLRIRGCKFVAVSSEGVFFPKSATRCFGSPNSARRRGYVPFASVPPSPTPTSTVAPSPTETPTGDNTPEPTATAEPTPTALPINYAFELGETTPGSGYHGTCTGTLNSARTNITIACIHNVTTASEVHLHIVPLNPRFCPLVTPPLDFLLSCDLTPELAQGIEAGNGLVAIHLAPGGEGQACAGLIH